MSEDASRIEELERALRRVNREYIELRARRARSSARLAEVTAERDEAREDANALAEDYSRCAARRDERRRQAEAAEAQLAVAREALERIAECAHDNSDWHRDKARSALAQLDGEQRG